MVENILQLGGSFQSVLSNPIYQGTFGSVATGFFNNSPLLMAFGFVQEFDAWTTNSALSVVMDAVVNLFQIMVGYFLFGCDVTDPQNCNGVLPSFKDKVLPIKEDRDGNIYMASGCDSEFEGELLWYGPAFDIIDKLIDAASDVIGQFFNAPVEIIQFVLQGVYAVDFSEIPNMLLFPTHFL